MSRAPMTTPCPAQPARDFSKRISVSSFDGFPDDTLDIDYTRAIQHEFRNAKPKRRPTMNRRAERMAPVTIFEDVFEDQELMLDGNSKKLEGKTLLGKPAQRIQPSAFGPRKANEPAVRAFALQDIGQARKRQSIMPREAVQAETEAKPQALHNVGQVRRRPSVVPNGESHQTAAEPDTRVVDKGMRRRTMYVPPDATTLMTIHPGSNDTNRLNDTFLFSNLTTAVAQSEKEETVADLPIFQKPVRRPRKSLAAAPRRMPLQHMDINQDGSSFDVAGANTGKENLPPHAQEKDELQDFPIKAPLASKRMSLAESRLHQPTAASHSRQSILVRKAVPLSHTKSVVPQKRMSTCKASASPVLGTQRIKSSVQPTSKPLATSKQLTPPKPPAIDRLQKQQQLRSMIESKRNTLRASKLAQYPTLSEDLSHPELYEDGWLAHQEVALAEVVNQIFKESERRPCQLYSSARSLRERMIETYHQSEVTAIHKRIQASLVYGALSRPKEMASVNVHHDIGLRKRFLGLWLDNYDEETLRVAAEVVVGRQIPTQSIGSVGVVQDSESLIDPHAGRRSLTAFLEMFFVAVGDVDTAEDSEGESGVTVDMIRWRKTMLRSFMLIWLLDHAKTSEDVENCLFQRNASKKSSTAVLNGLCSMLLPSVGDVSRTLRHMDYEVSHVQDPLDEVHYRAENLAVDLRDGVLITHLVEILLYESARERAADEDENATVTIALPDAKILESALNSPERSRYAPRILSRHLKMPCIGRAQKMFNVQVALSALEGHNVLGANVVGDISASDLVDGHREKTLSMLWSLVASFGLGVLVDWRELAVDIARNGGEVEIDTTFASRDAQEALLQSWASAHSPSARVANFTSSFASGKVYASIVNAFATFITNPGEDVPSTGLTEHSILETRLRVIGCSSAFIKQLTSTLGVVPSRETTISNLAFLASRLLPLARSYHATIKIQRAYRQRIAKQTVTRRVALMRLAHACTTVVQTRNRIVNAAEILQRAWRRVLAARIERLSADVVSFQALAKGWMTRRHRSMEGNSPPQYVTAGW